VSCASGPTPANLPVALSTEFELDIYAGRSTSPPLARADEVIE
jgi:hypothetical protein